MEERLICAFMVIPAFVYLSFEFENKRLEKILRVISATLLLLLACYLGVVCRSGKGSDLIDFEVFVKENVNC